MENFKQPNKYNIFLSEELFIRNFVSGADLGGLLVQKFGVTESYSRKLLERAVTDGYISSSAPLSFVKGQYLYFSSHKSLDLQHIKLIAKNLRPPMYRLIELLQINGGIVSYYEALKVSSSPEEKNSSKINTLEELVAPLRRLNLVYEKKDKNNMEFIIEKTGRSELPEVMESAMMEIQYQRNVMDCMMIPDVLNWLRKCNIIDNLKTIYRSKNIPSVGAQHNNILWDAFGYTKTTGINDLQGAFSDSIKKQTLVTLDIVVSRTYSQTDLEGYLSRVQLHINSAKSKRKVLPILIYSQIEEIALNTARKLGFVAFDLGSIFGKNIYRVIDNLQAINADFDKLSSAQTIDETLEILETSGQEEALKQLRGALFEALLYPLMKRLYPNAEIYPSKILYQQKEDKKQSHEYDYLILSSQPKEIVLVELKGYPSTSSIAKGVWDEAGTIEYFFSNAVPFAKEIYRQEIQQGKRLTAAFITSGYFKQDGTDYLETFNNGKLKPSELNTGYNGEQLLELLKKYDFEHEIKTIKKYYIKAKD
jgi:hypothetical protein